MKKLTFSFLLLLSFLGLKAQGPMWQLLSNGNDVNDMKQDGSIYWVGTTGGLVKYDTTSQITSFYNFSNSGLTDNIVNHIAIDTSHNIWIATEQQLFYFNTNANVITDFSYNYSIRDMKVDHHNNLWLAVAFNDITEYSSQGGWTTYHQPGGIDFHPNCVYIDADNNSWFSDASEGHGVMKYDGLNWTHLYPGNSGLNGLEVWSIKGVGNEICFSYIDWGSQVTCTIYNNGTWANESSAFGNSQWDVAAGPDSSFYFNDWYQFRDSIAIFHNNSWSYISTGQDSIFATNIFIDAQNNLWRSEMNKCIYEGLWKRHSDGSWTQRNTSNSHLWHYGTDMALDNSGNMLVMNDENFSTIDSNLNIVNHPANECVDGYYRIGVNGQNQVIEVNYSYLVNSTTGDTLTFPGCGAGTNDLSPLLFDGGKLWACTVPDGCTPLLIGWNGSVVSDSVNLPVLGGNNMNSFKDMCLDDNNNIWVSILNSDSGYSLFKYTIGDPSAILIPTPVGFEKLSTDTQGNLWGLGFNGNGFALERYDSSGWTEYDLPSPNYENILGMKWSQNYLWIGTDRMLRRFSNGNVITYNYPLNNILPDYGQMVPFNDHEVALNSHMGVLIFNAEGANSPSNIAEGYVFEDTNNNGLMDSTEQGLPSQIVVSGNNVSSTDLSGHYTMQLGTGIFTLEYSPDSYYSSSDDTANVSFSSQGGALISNLNFPAHTQPNVQDLTISLTATRFRPGFNSNLWMNCSNQGTMSISGTTFLVMDTALNFVSAYPSPDQVSGDTLKWNYSNLPPNVMRLISCELNTPSNTSIGTGLQFKATVEPIATDSTPANNSIIYNTYVHGSLDPNEKTVFPAGQGVQNTIDTTQKTLTYTIQFQNTGTDTALSIMIKDTLNQNLDITTFRMLGASNPVTWSITDRVVTFTFSNILLPDSNTNEAASHGFVQYAINMSDGLPYGETISNTAYIFFDFNAPVATNTVTNTLGNVILSVELSNPPGNLSTIVYPNPMTNDAIIEIQSPGFGEYNFTLYDETGQMMMRRIISDGKMKIKRGTLASGMYFYEVKDKDGNTSRGKIVIQ